MQAHDVKKGAKLVNSLRFTVVLVMGLGLSAVACTREVEVTKQVVVTATPPPAAAPAPPRDLTVLVGTGQDTVAVNAFFPETIRVHAGDTITWKINSDELHSVSFGGEGLIGEELIPIAGGGPTDVQLNPGISFPTRPPGGPTEIFDGGIPAASGIMKNAPLSPGAPLNDTFTLTFDKPGVYQYVCQIHPFTMRGSVIVEVPTADDMPAQAEIDAQATTEMTSLLGQIDTIKTEAAKAVTQVPGPGDTTIWLVQAGGISRDNRVELLEFLAKDIVIKEGDTVVWTSPSFHNVAFHPGSPQPEWVLPRPQENGPPVLVINPEVAFPARPADAFDGTGYWSAGLIGDGAFPAHSGLRSLTGGSNFVMTFNKAGTFKYLCAFHQEFGMEGSVTVVQR